MDLRPQAPPGSADIVDPPDEDKKGALALLILDISKYFEFDADVKVVDLADYLFAGKSFSGQNFVDQLRKEGKTNILIARAVMNKWKAENALETDKGVKLYDSLTKAHPEAARDFQEKLMHLP